MSLRLLLRPVGKLKSKGLADVIFLLFLLSFIYRITFAIKDADFAD